MLVRIVAICALHDIYVMSERSVRIVLAQTSHFEIVKYDVARVGETCQIVTRSYLIRAACNWRRACRIVSVEDRTRPRTPGIPSLINSYVNGISVCSAPATTTPVPFTASVRNSARIAEMPSVTAPKDESLSRCWRYRSTIVRAVRHARSVKPRTSLANPRVGIGSCSCDEVAIIPGDRSIYRASTLGVSEYTTKHHQGRNFRSTPAASF